jgi:thymidylate synthase (FAD)
MKVKLISYTQPNVEESTSHLKNLQDLVAYCARVSNPSNQMNKETNDRLISYLISHQHWSPLEMVNVCLEIETTRDIARQILRHRSFSFQEFSQRYAEVDLQWETREARLQDLKNRQNSIDTDNQKLEHLWELHQETIQIEAEKVYRWAIENGIAKEQARVVLPEGMTPSRLYMNGSLRSWVHYIQLRTEKGTQKEHRKIAKACAEAIEQIFPMINQFVCEE